MEAADGKRQRRRWVGGCCCCFVFRRRKGKRGDLVWHQVCEAHPKVVRPSANLQLDRPPYGPMFAPPRSLAVAYVPIRAQTRQDSGGSPPSRTAQGMRRVSSIGVGAFLPAPGGANEGMLNNLLIDD